MRSAADYRAIGRSPYGFLPIGVLTLLGIVAAFDAAVFGPVLPSIVRDLDVTPGQVLTALNIVGFFFVGATLILAHFLDRVKRVPFVGGGAILNGIFSIFTARSSSVATLAGSRVADAIGTSAGGLPQFSLIADYYTPEVRGKVFAFSGVLGSLAGLAAPLAVGLLVISTTSDPQHPNWRLPYLITGPALIVVGILALFLLREPVRGYMERRALGLPEEEARGAIEDPPSFGEAWRTVWSVRVLRRLFIADIPQAVGARIFTTVFPLWLAERYSFDALDIAKLATVVGVFGLLGGFLSGGIVDSLTARRPQRVLVFVGILGIVSSLSWILFASGPPLWVLYIGGALFGIAGSLLGPARAVIYAQIVPANMRTLGLAVRGLASVPALIIYQFSVIQVVNTAGLQVALYLAIPFLLVGGIIDLSAAPFFERDMRAAMASQLASQEWRKTRAEGRGKLLVCRDVDVSYGDVQVVFGVDLDVADGEILALLGTNGAGKSTLLRAISGSREASSGAIVFDGRDITHMPPAEVAARGVVLMPGGRGVFPGLSVRENLALATWTSDRGSEPPLDEVFEVFPVLRERSDEPAGALSGGEQQMVSLAQAFLARPRLLMIDELSLGLGPGVVEQLIGVVRELNLRGVTVILVEQSVNVALTVADRAVFMEKGEVRFDGPTAELLERPDILRSVYVRGTVGGAISTERRGTPAPGPPILEVRGVSKRFGGITALDDVTFDVQAGGVVGLIGPNGAGKTTLFDVIGGSQVADEGTILLDGVDVTRLGAADRAARRLVRRFQDARLVPSLTVHENVLLALDRRLEVRNVASVALRTPGARAAERRSRRQADTLIEMLRLEGHRDRFAKELSTGLRRIVDLACVLATDPTLLLLDEPSTGIAQAEAESLAPLLRRVRHETGCTILIIEHDMALIRAVSDELIAMDQGRILLRGEPDAVLDDERVIRSYLGTSEEAIGRTAAPARA